MSLGGTSSFPDSRSAISGNDSVMYISLGRISQKHPIFSKINLHSVKYILRDSSVTHLQRNQLLYKEGDQ